MTDTSIVSEDTKIKKKDLFEQFIDSRIVKAQKIASMSDGIIEDINDESLSLVKSDNKKENKYYVVNLSKDGMLSCSCYDCKERMNECKHIKAKLERLRNPDKYKDIIPEKKDIKSMISNLESIVSF